MLVILSYPENLNQNFWMVLFERGFAEILFFFYSITQSYANSFLDVVLDSFNNVSRDEDNFLNQYICI